MSEAEIVGRINPSVNHAAASYQARCAELEAEFTAERARLDWLIAKASAWDLDIVRNEVDSRDTIDRLMRNPR